MLKSDKEIGIVVTNPPIILIKSLMNDTNGVINSIDDITSQFDYDTLCDNQTLITSFIEDPFICNRYIR